jgi:hypothetical protein
MKIESVAAKVKRVKNEVLRDDTKEINIISIEFCLVLDEDSQGL